MAVDAGSAVGYLDLDIDGFVKGLATALRESRETEAQIQSVGDKISTVGKKMTGIGKTLTTSVTTPLLGVGTMAIKTLADFDSSMSKVAAISGATGEDFEALRNKAREMGNTTKFTAKESADAFTYMAMAGWKTQDMLEGIDGIMALSAADGLDLATTSDIVTDALTAFGLSASDSSHFADVLAKASSSANTNVAMLGESFKYVAPMAGALGYSVEDTSIALGLMANSGIKASQAGTSLRSALSKLIQPTDNAAQVMEEYGLSLFNADGSSKSLMGVMQNLRDVFGDNNISIENMDGSLKTYEELMQEASTGTMKLSDQQKLLALSTVFGTESLTGMLAIINASEKDYDSLTQSIYNAEGAAQAMADIQLDNFSGQVEILKSNMSEAAMQIGEILLPYVSDFVGKIQEVVQWFSNLDPKQQQQIVKWAGIAAAIGPVLLVVGKLTSGVGKMVSGIEKAAGVLGKLGSSSKKVPGPVGEASSSVGALSRNALGLVAAGAGILLAASGLALLAFASIQLASAGGPAIAIMGGMVVALAGLAAGATLVAAPLTAGAVGLIAFGAAVALVGAGIGIASAGVALLATQLPTISSYGSSAASAFVVLSEGLMVFGGGALVAGGGCTVLGAGLAIVGTGSTIAAVGVVALGAAVVVLGAGAVVLGAGLVICGAGMSLLAASASTAASGIAAFGASSLASVAGTAALSAGILALDASVVTGLVTLGLLTVELGLSAAACGLLAAAMASTAQSVSTIESSATNASNALSQMVDSVSVVESGLSGLGAMVSGAMDQFVSTIKKTQNPAKTESLALSNAIVTSINTGLAPLPSQMASVGSRSVDSFRSSMSSEIGGLSSNAYTWGQDVITGLANGIRSRYPVLQSAVNGAASIISARLHFSVPDEGPLTTYESWMPDFIQGLARGIYSNLYRIKPAVSSLANAMVPELPINEALTTEMQAISQMESYNDTIVVTIGLYGQLLSQIRELSAISNDLRVQDNESLYSMSRVLSRRTDRSTDYETPLQGPDSHRTGDIFNFYSPKPITEAEAARQMKKAKRDLAEGF